MLRARWAILLTAVAFTAIALALVFTSDHESTPAFTAAANLIVAWSFIACGVVALARVSDAHFGLLMSAVGLTWFLSALTESNNSYVFSVGNLLWGIPLAFFIHALLTFPRGYLETKIVFAVVAAAYGLLSLAPLLFSLFGEAGCSDCPQNEFVLVDSNLATTIVGVLFIGVGLFVCGATIWVLIRRWRVASAPLRRILTPVFVTSATAIGAFLLAAFVSAVSETASSVLWWLVLFAVASVPTAFLVGLLRTRLARASVASLVLELGVARDPESTRDALRKALGDPSLNLAYWLSDRSRWVGVSGWEVDLEAASQGRRTTLVEHDGEVVAAFIHDPSVDRELAGAVSAAASLALAREQSIQVVRQSESRYRALLNAIPDLMFRMSRDGTYLDFKGDRDDLAVPPEELIGSNARDILPADVAEGLLEGIAHALDTGEVATGEYELTLNDVQRTFEARIVRDGDEAVLIVRDISERKRQEDELRGSRVRLLRAGDEARRRLERNLHDGAQQRLVSLSLALRLAHARLRDAPEEAERLLAGASEELAQALEELRELARGIHPAVLSERGLSAALEALAGRAPVPVGVTVPPDRFPPAVEAAAYYVISEALANVAKYAEASAVEIRVTRQNGRAVVEVADDGVGGADPTRGSGLSGLVDRVEALDGVLKVDSAPGAGTRIRAEIPCE
ncbi:MAG TPA: PAS domain-containing protein [Gaiellaceae bacterium]|jgi:PAS domain S-box-containing protein|nr:PAS domain-containing protein [Gaiellaceae bacterium]